MAGFGGTLPGDFSSSAASRAFRRMQERHGIHRLGVKQGAETRILNRPFSGAGEAFSP